MDPRLEISSSQCRALCNNTQFPVSLFSSGLDLGPYLLPVLLSTQILPAPGDAVLHSPRHLTCSRFPALQPAVGLLELERRQPVERLLIPGVVLSALSLSSARLLPAPSCSYDPMYNISSLSDRIKCSTITKI